MPIWIADIHTQYQAGISIEQIAREGISLVLVKASQGTSWFADSTIFKDWQKRIRASGMIPGAYHWLNSSDGAKQAQAFIIKLQTVGGPSGMVCAVDVEDEVYPPTYATIVAFVNEWKRLTNNHPLVIYTGNWWRQRQYNGSALSSHLWFSEYVSGSDFAIELYSKVPSSWWTPGIGKWPKAEWLQFTNKAKVAGQLVDASVYLGDRNGLLALTGSDVDMVDWTDPDTFGATPDGVVHSYGGMIRDAFWGVQTLSNRLTSLETSVSAINANVTMTDEQMTTLVNMVAGMVDARIEAAIRKVLGGLDN
jgi:GH25 family lysozyme M1 (1,4-beta-N-acetylmuramidase)